MGKVHVKKVILILIFVFTVSACAPSTTDIIPPTETIEVSQANPVITSAGLDWAELQTTDPCQVQQPSPIIRLCVQNQGQIPASPEFAYYALPVEAAPALQKSIMQTLPGGNWKPAEFITIEGLPGTDGSGVEGIIIVNTAPAGDGYSPVGGVPPDDSLPPPDDSMPQGIIILNFLPPPDDNSPPPDDSMPQGIIIIENMPGADDSTEGILIMPALDGTSQVMGIIMEDKPGEDGSKGIIIVDSMPVADSGAQGIIIVEGMPGADSGAEGIIIVENMPGADSGPPPDDNQPPPDDGMPQGIIIVEGLPGADSGTQGIIIVDGLPGIEGSSEGILIMPGLDGFSQVMGVIVEDKTGEDGAEGIIVVDSMPGADIGAKGIIIVEGMPVVDIGAKGIIIINGMPSGFEMGEGMTAMMGEGGFGPGPYLIGKFELTTFGFPAELGPGEESCVQVVLSPNQSDPLEGSDQYYPADSFFDVFFELDTNEPQSENTASNVVKVVQVQGPSFPQCTPIPDDILPTATATQPPPSATSPPVATATSPRPTATNTPIPEVGQIKVHLYIDGNESGNQDRSEANYPGVKVSLRSCSCSERCSESHNATTNDDGNVLFNNLPYGPYCITTDSRLTPTTTYPVNVNVNSPSLTTVSIGYK